jgi:hypothetical protein
MVPHCPHAESVPGIRVTRVKSYDDACVYACALSGKGVSNVLIENVRLNDIVDDEASLTAFWSAMPPDGSPHVNITFRRVACMRTKRDGINVHGQLIGWTGEE